MLPPWLSRWFATWHRVICHACSRAPAVTTAMCSSAWPRQLPERQLKSQRRFFKMYAIAAQVTFVDFGNKETVQGAAVRAISPELSALAPQAQMLQLANLKVPCFLACTSLLKQV